MGRFFYCSRWHAEANSYYGEMARYGELSIEPAYFLVLQHVQTGNTEEALTMADRFVSQSGAAPAYRAAIAELYALCQQEEPARLLIEQARLLDLAAHLSHFRRARLSLAMHQPAQALDLLQSSFLQREPELPWIVADPLFDDIRDDPAFKRIQSAVYPF